MAYKADRDGHVIVLQTRPDDLLRRRASPLWIPGRRAAYSEAVSCDYRPVSFLISIFSLNEINPPACV